MTATVVAPGLGRSFPANLAALMLALIVGILAQTMDQPALYGAMAACFVAGLALTHGCWIGRRGGRIALLLTVLAILATWLSGGDPVRVATTAARMSDVIVLILCVALIRPALAELKLDHAVAAMAAGAPRCLRGCAVLCGVAVFGLGLSFGAIGVFGGSLRGRTNGDAVAARAAMRGLALSMLLGPSTASVAAVMAAYPQTGWGGALATGLPIAAAGIVLGGFSARRLAIAAPAASRAERTRALLAILAVPAGAAMLNMACGLAVTLAIAAAAVCVAIVLVACAVRDRRAWPRALARFDAGIGQAWAESSAETALFLACGLVLGAMREPVLADAARTAVAPWLPSGLAGVLFLTIAVPLITTIGIHPMALFAVLSPVVTPGLLGLPPANLFQAWIVAIGLSMVVSPASILTMTTVSGFGVPAGALCLRGNGRYALGLALFASALLFLWK